MVTIANIRAPLFRLAALTALCCINPRTPHKRSRSTHSHHLLLTDGDSKKLVQGDRIDGAKPGVR